MKKRRTNRVKPLLDIICSWDGHSEYPSEVRLAMDNGKFADYTLNVQQPKPNVFRSMPVVVGYQYKGKK